MEILAVALLLAGVVVLFKTVRMVPQGYEWTVERFGKYTHTMTPGLHFLIPVVYGVGRKINAQNFRGGEATALLGGVKIDLHDAAITAEEAVIDVFAFWGGIEIAVPDGWAVVNRVVAVLGGAEDRTRPPVSPTAKRLVIRGICIMGGVEIKSA